MAALRQNSTKVHMINSLFLAQENTTQLCTYEKRMKSYDGEKKVNREENFKIKINKNQHRVTISESKVSGSLL